MRAFRGIVRAMRPRLSACPSARWAPLAQWLRRAVCLWPLAAPAVAAPTCPPPLPQPTEAQFAAAERTDRGLLWSLERDGRTSYLYGTMHVGRPEWTRLGPRVSEALRASDVVALEIDPTDAGTQAELTGQGGKPARLPPALRTRLERQIAAACLPRGALAALDPAMQAVTLSVLEARWAGLDALYAQELALAERAHANAQPIVALETAALQKQLLVPTSSAETAALIDTTLRQLEAGSGRRSIARLAQAWENGDLAALSDYPRWCDCARTPAEQAAMRALNDDRNPGLADGIARLHGEGRTVFAAVGALHMTGPQALPKLMAERGFKVQQRVPPGAQ